MIIWELWKRRNSLKHEGKILSTQRVIFNITKNIGLLLKVRDPRKDFTNSWHEILKELEIIKAKVNIIKVNWKFAEEGWIKYNTDGSSRGNSGISSYAFYFKG